MNNWPNNGPKTRHLAFRQNRPRLIESSKRASGWPLIASKTGRSSHTISIQSAFVLRFRFRLWAGFLHWTSSLDWTSHLHDGRVFCFHVGICIKARPIKWKRGRSSLIYILFLGGGEFETMNTRPKFPRMSISTAVWTRSLTNAIKWKRYSNKQLRTTSTL